MALELRGGDQAFTFFVKFNYDNWCFSHSVSIGSFGTNIQPRSVVLTRSLIVFYDVMPSQSIKVYLCFYAIIFRCFTGDIFYGIRIVLSRAILSSQTMFEIKEAEWYWVYSL
jgi:hypothetical protein